MTTHFGAGGVTNIYASHPMKNLGTVHPARWMLDFDDFFDFVDAEWTTTEVGAGTEALTAGDGGLLLMTNAAADDNSTAVQRAVANMRLDAKRDACFEAQLKVSDAVQSDIVAGLQAKDTTPFAVSDGIFFSKPDGAAVIDLAIFKASAGSLVAVPAVATLISDTFIKLQWYYDASAARLYFGTDDVVRGYTEALTNFPNTVDLTLSFAVQNGEAVAKTMTVDYVMAGRARF